MANAPIFRGTVTNGQLRVDEPARWNGYLARFNGKRIRVTLSRETTQRSQSQNAYLWAVVYPTLAEWSGHDVDELHEVFKAKFLPARELEAPGGVRLSSPGSTSTLSIEEFSAYVDNVKRFAAEQGLYIPDPHEVA